MSVLILNFMLKDCIFSSLLIDLCQLSRLADYEAGVYGLSEAMRDVKRLKKSVKAGEEDLQACLTKLNHRNRQMEDLLEENRCAPFRSSAEISVVRLKSPFFR